MKYNKLADAIGYLYRTAFYLAKGDSKLALDFLEKAFRNINKDHIRFLKPLSEKPELIKEETKRLYWAEKILDEYKRLYFLFLR